MTSTRALTTDRIREAELLLLARVSPSAAVAELADRWGLSRRSARNYVGKALEQLRADLEPIDRAQMLSLAVDVLGRAAAQALETRQPGAAVAAVRQLDQLLALGATAGQ